MESQASEPLCAREQSHSVGNLDEKEEGEI